MIIVIFSWSWQLLFIKGWSRAVHSGMYPKVQWKRGGSPGLLSYGSSYVWQITEVCILCIVNVLCNPCSSLFCKVYMMRNCTDCTGFSTNFMAACAPFSYLHNYFSESGKQSWQYMQISSAISGLSSFLVKVYLVIMSQNTVKSS